MENYEENIENIFKLLKEGGKLKNISPGADSVLFLGNTGAGKSTLTQFIFADNNTLESVEVSEGDFIIEDGNKISKSTFLSHTFVPELVSENETCTQSYDCPGFSDTRSTCHDIASTHFIMKLAESGGRVKIILTVNYSSVRIGVDRQDFVTLVKHVTQFIRNITKYKDGIALVVTKVDNIFARKENAYTLVPDDVVINGIAKFLTEFKQHIKDMNYCENAIALVDTLLFKEGGKYTRIALFRRPDQAGPLSRMSLLQDEKNSIKTLIQNNIKFTEVGRDDLGFTVSERSRNIINDFKETIIEEISKSMCNIVEELKAYYHDKEEEMKDVSQFVDEMDESIKYLTAMYAEISELKHPKQLVRIVSETFRKLQVTIEMEDLHAIEKFVNYWSFLETVTERELATTPSQWGYYVVSVMNQLKDKKMWYKFLLNLHKKLLWLGFPHNMKIPVTTEELSSSNDHHYNIETFFSAIEQYDIDGLNVVRSMLVDEIKLKALNELLDLNLKLELKIEDTGGNNRVASGGVVKVSKLNMSSLPQTVKSFYIFASDTVVIDEDIVKVGHELELCLLAPRWEVSGTRKIVLDGCEGQPHVPEKAQNGNGNSMNTRGGDGNNGVPGGNAGDFFGIGAVFVNGENLTISTQGGNGGRGQAGGDGVDGQDGSDVDVNTVPLAAYIYNLESMGFTRTYINYTFPYANYVFEKKGENGSDGGDGGNGGRGGHGGIKGENIVYSLSGESNIIHISGNGFDGEDGKCGKGGVGGKNGLSLRVEFSAVLDFSIIAIPFYVGYMAHDVPYTQTRQRAKSGKGGVLRRSAGESPRRKISLLSKAKIMNDFKSFLFSILHNKIVRNYTVKFMTQMNTNESVKKSYDALGFAKELEIIETVFNTTNDSLDAMPFYECLLERLKYYYEETNSVQQNNDNMIVERRKRSFWGLHPVDLLSRLDISKLLNSKKAPSEHNQRESLKCHKVLSHLYMAVRSKIHALKRSSEHSFVVNINDFLDITLEHVRKFHSVHRDEFVNRLRTNYKEKIDTTTKEILRYMEAEVVPEIEKINSESDINIEEIAKEVVNLQKQALSEKDRLIERKAKLQKELQLKRVFEVLKTVAKVLSLYVKLAFPVCTVLEFVQPFILKNDTDRMDLMKLPKGVRSLLQSAQVTVNKYKCERVKALKQQLDTLSKNVSRNSKELNDLKTPIAALKERLNEVNAADEDDPDQITNIEQDLKRELENKVKKVNKNAGNAIEVLENALKALTVAEVCVDVYQRCNNDQSKLNCISNSIKQTQSKIDQLKSYENQIHKFVSPIMKDVQSYVKDVQNSLPAMSKMYLRIKRREVQTTLKDMKLKMCDFTEGFKTQEKFACCFDKIDDTISTLIGLYDQIESYSEHKQFIDYIADMNSERLSSTEIESEELRDALSKVDKLITFNILLSEYERFVAAFKQWVFPFAEYYLRDLSLPTTLVPSDDLDNQAGNIQNQLEFLKRKLKEYNSSIITGIDDSIHHEEFNSDQEVTEPFFVWRNEKYKESISKLLSGEAVTLKADILNGVKKSSLKFRSIEINLKCPTVKSQEELNSILKHFRVILKHHGNSYYQCGGKFYVIRSESQTVQYSFARKQNGEPVSQISVYKKIKNGDFMLSPYAMWTIQLARYKGEGFKELGKYKDCVDLELIGEGRYVKSTFKIAQMKLQRYYETDDSITESEMLGFSQCDY
ncbi:uncharacterized protein [Periplaneta americana]|uniref:uncharacterized protein isoform X1 n=1 Tax=Periplaneta americana TaxID=6978 RepID=UPI0037E8DD80